MTRQDKRVLASARRYEYTYGRDEVEKRDESVRERLKSWSCPPEVARDGGKGVERIAKTEKDRD